MQEEIGTELIVEVSRVHMFTYSQFLAQFGAKVFKYLVEWDTSEFGELLSPFSRWDN